MSTETVVETTWRQLLEHHPDARRGSHGAIKAASAALRLRQLFPSSAQPGPRPALTPLATRQPMHAPAIGLHAFERELPALGLFASEASAAPGSALWLVVRSAARRDVEPPRTLHFASFWEATVAATQTGILSAGSDGRAK
ncbi:DUF6193 family natural product biosynthesis protein [Streptomyces decoyicus]